MTSASWSHLSRHSLHHDIQANLEKEVEREKALAEAEGRIKENRQNEDVNRRAMQLRLEEERKKLVEAINTTFTNLGSGTLALLTDKERLGTAVAGLTVLALGVYSAREGTRVAGQVFSRYAATFLPITSQTFECCSSVNSFVVLCPELSCLVCFLSCW